MRKQQNFSCLLGPHMKTMKSLDSFLNDSLPNWLKHLNTTPQLTDDVKSNIGGFIYMVLSFRKYRVPDPKLCQCGTCMLLWLGDPVGWYNGTHHRLGMLKIVFENWKKKRKKIFILLNYCQAFFKPFMFKPPRKRGSFTSGQVSVQDFLKLWNPVSGKRVLLHMVQPIIYSRRWEWRRFLTWKHNVQARELQF